MFIYILATGILYVSHYSALQGAEKVLCRDKEWDTCLVWTWFLNDLRQITAGCVKAQKFSSKMDK